jgi:hypothetical protein
LYKLVGGRADPDGPYCGPDGLYVGGSPLIARLGAAYRVRTEDEIATVLAAAYGAATDARALVPRLRAVAAFLQDGDTALAMIATLHLRLGEISDDAFARVARTDALLKYNFNPDEPRDPHGRWTDEGGSSAVEPYAETPSRSPIAPSDTSPGQKPTQVAQNAPVEFSPHALSRMQRRGITPTQVLDVIENGIRVTQPNGNIRCTGSGCVVILSPAGRIVTIY